MKNLLFKVEIQIRLTFIHLFFMARYVSYFIRYDTSIFGEALVQKVTCKAVPSWAPTYVAFIVTLKVFVLNQKAFKEAGRLGEAADKKDLICRSPLSLLERDIEEVRKEFNTYGCGIFEMVKNTLFRGDKYK